MQNRVKQLSEIDVIYPTGFLDVQMCHQARGNLWVDVLNTLGVRDDLTVKHLYSASIDPDHCRGGPPYSDLLTAPC